MHAAQRKAIFAMVDSVENQCRYIKSLLLMDDQVETTELGRGTRAAPEPNRPTPGGSAYLSEKEERDLEDEHEEARAMALRDHQAKTQTDWNALRQIADQETPVPMIP